MRGVFPRSLIVALLWLVVGACTARSGAPRLRKADSVSLKRDAGEAAPARDGAPRGDEDGGEAVAVSLAHNIIVVMGDGMGAQQIAAGRLAAGGRLRMDVMAGPALVNTDSLTTLRVQGDEPPATDSAAAASAIATGERVENDVLSLRPDGAAATTMLELCQRAGKSVGLVTTSAFFDASPAAFIAHQPSRGLYEEIAQEMIAAAPEVLMGAGQTLFDDPALNLHLAADGAGYEVVRSAAELAAWTPNHERRLLGLFATDFVPEVSLPETFSMTPELERRDDSPDPRLATMTARALQRLESDPDGFFLFAEDELTDEIAHRGPGEPEWGARALPRQVQAIDATVGVVLDWVAAHSSFGETLVVVLADHETGGYQLEPGLGPEAGTFSAFVEEGIRVGIHTRTPVELRALGPGSDAVSRIRSHLDTHALLVGTLR